jgi:hypothetical protein
MLRPVLKLPSMIRSARVLPLLASASLVGCGLLVGLGNEPATDPYPAPLPNDASVVPMLDSAPLDSNAAADATPEPALDTGMTWDAAADAALDVGGTPGDAETLDAADGVDATDAGDVVDTADDSDATDATDAATDVVDGLDVHDASDAPAVGWLRLSPTTPPARRTTHALAWDGRSLWLFGGTDLGIVYDDLHRWDGTRWIAVEPAGALPSPRSSAVLVAEGEGRLLLFGGTRGGDRVGDTWRFENGAWAQLAPKTSPVPRDNACAVNTGSSIVLFGGRAHTTEDQWNDTWVWDGTDWTARTTTKSPPAGPCRMALWKGQPIVGPRRGFWTFDGTDWSEERGFSGYRGDLDGHAFVALDRDRLLIFGGFGDDSVRRSDTWLLVGMTWTRVSGPAPSARATVGGTVAGGALVFGGFDGTRLDDTWFFRAP